MIWYEKTICPTLRSWTRDFIAVLPELAGHHDLVKVALRAGGDLGRVLARVGRRVPRQPGAAADLFGGVAGSGAFAQAAHARTLLDVLVVHAIESDADILT